MSRMARSTHALLSARPNDAVSRLVGGVARASVTGRMNQAVMTKDKATTAAPPVTFIQSGTGRS